MRKLTKKEIKIREEKKQRAGEILRKRKEGKTLEEIGREVGMTRQGVSLILRKHGQKGGLYRRWRYECNNCGKLFLTIYSNCKLHEKHNRFCSHSCLLIFYRKPKPIPKGFELIETNERNLEKLLTTK